jgi:cytochrome c-type biogenesis protein CcmH
VAAGDSNRDIVAWMVARYGNFVRLSPPLTPATLVLWGSPVLALLAGAAAVVLSRGRGAPPAPLDKAEEARLERLLNP